MSRHRANSETVSFGNNSNNFGLSLAIGDCFLRYTIPPRSIQTRFLGCASLGLAGSQSMRMAFYEIAECDKSTECADALLSLSEGHENEDTSLLPPKKRSCCFYRRRQLPSTISDVVFCQESISTAPSLLDTVEYFLFPRDAVVEAVSPVEVICSFHPPVLQAQDGRKRRLTHPIADQSFNDCHVTLTGVSSDLYLAIKHAASTFEAMCEKMYCLMQHHEERIAFEKAEIFLKEEDESMQLTNKPEQHQGHAEITTTTTTIEQWSSLTTTTTTTAADNRASNNSSDNAQVVKTETKTTSGTKQCHYCGSKSTPMWRRGPKGAGTLCNACGVKWKNGKILCKDMTTATHLVVRDQKKKKPRKKKASPKRDTRRSSSSHRHSRNKDAGSGGTSDSCSPIESPYSSPLALGKASFGLLAATTGTAAEDMDLMTIDAVEAAAVLTLLKQS
ncbi:hypothetical protein BCR43DRAFT_494138 [Syncephalastrum racemosum]|uniref:GATA-type domain-containing protein n=1 Tax=Syncephalastrum racemosum TaxID=13706 RepID=A0A1X2H7I1_SYNRA|nr:hypothetical protein BCR43DRAFT_494138 [Syncephalastrum racemosum]